jgi:hypothetical protein
MSTETLRSLSHETVQIYAHTAKTIVKTYRVGAKRALGGFRSRLGSVAGAIKVERPLKNSIVNLGEQVVALIGTRVDALSSAADGAIDAVAKRSSMALGTFAGAADKFYRVFPSRAPEVFAQINLPAVRLSRNLAEQISRGAEGVARRVEGEAGAKIAKPVRRPAKKAARTATPARKRARKA